MDKIIIKGASFLCNIGTLPKERVTKQEIFVDVELFLDIKKVVLTDDIESTVNYSRVYDLIKAVVEGKEYSLIETLANNIASKIMQNFNIGKVIVRVKKPNALAHKNVKYVAVEITRKKMVSAYIGIGSNLGNKEENIKKSIDFMKEKCKILRVSSLHKTEPVGFKEQDWFLNCAVKIETYLESRELLEFLQSIEKRLGRVRIIKNGPRTIDLDILFYDDKILNENNLIIPHPRLHERLFALESLNEVSPNLVHPVLKRSINKLYNKLKK